MPWLNRYVRLALATAEVQATNIGCGYIYQRGMMKKLIPKTEKAEIPADRRDMQSRFLDTQKADPDLIDDLRVLSYAASNVNAGDGHHRITLTAIVYYLLKYPATLRRLEDEILTAVPKGDLSSPCVSWIAAQKIPYLDAVIGEALRIHPAVGLLLERVVPPVGMTIYGRRIPGGTIVGVNPWVMSGDTTVFGADAHRWRPERWLDIDKAILREMNRFNFTFGAGTRTCIGENISLLEMYQVIPSMLQEFKLLLTHPEKE